MDVLTSPPRQALADMGPWLQDAIDCKSVVRDPADLMLVHPSSSGHVWICVVRGSAERWSYSIAEVQRPSEIDTSYALRGNRDQLANVADVHREFVALLGPLVTTSDTGPTRLLRVKVAPSEHWFLRFPLGLFAKCRLSGFEHHSGCQWIVTDRTLSAVATRQIEVEEEMSRTEDFFCGAHIIINTYERHAVASDAEIIRSGYALILDLLHTLERLPFGTNDVSLRWTMNPDADHLSAILRSDQTRYVFANFEADDGIWTLADSACGTDDHFDLAPLAGRLSHIRLMRIFHCNSLYNPYEPTTAPADNTTLAAALLRTGAFFVEGSVTSEPVVDFICMILSLLLQRADVQSILYMQYLAGDETLPDMVTQANALLATRGFALVPEIGQNLTFGSGVTTHESA